MRGGGVTFNGMNVSYKFFKILQLIQTERTHTQPDMICT
jgi:hypothetical protein